MYPEIPNRLDAVVLNLCLKEVETLRFERFMGYMLQDPWIKGIQFVIVCNGILKRDSDWFKTLESHVGPITVHDLDLEPIDDLYDKKRLLNPRKVRVPPLGFFSGPNILFFKSIGFSQAQEYNTMFLIETDLHFEKGWLQKLKAYVDGNVFLIAGSNPSHPTERHLTDHLNGVALYKTGSKNFSRFMDLVRKHTIETCKTNPWYPYDYAVWHTFKHLANIKEEQQFYRFLFRTIHCCHLLVNLVSEAAPEKAYEFCKTYYPGSCVFHIDSDKFVIESEQ